MTLLTIYGKTAYKRATLQVLILFEDGVDDKHFLVSVVT